MAKKTAIHRSNPNAHAAEMGRFLVWAKDHPKEAWEQAVEERESKPWMLRALRSREGEKVRELIRSIFLEDLMKAEAKLASFPKPNPAKVLARNELEEARKRYSEIETALRSRPRPRRR